MPKQKTIRRFALVEKEILYSKSWKDLTDSARVLYLHLKGEFDGSNADNLVLPYSHMKGILSHASFWRGIKLLSEIGFIDVVFHGGKPRKDTHDKREHNIYKISGRWRTNEKSIAEYKEETERKTRRWLYQRSSEIEDPVQV